MRRHHISIAAVWATVLLCVRGPLAAYAQCEGDFNSDGQVTVDELLTAVDNALLGCTLVPRFVVDSVDIHELNATLPVSGTPIDSGTISFEVQSTWDGSDDSVRSLVRIGPPTQVAGLGILKVGHFMRFLITNDSGVEAGFGIDLSFWKAGQSYQLSLIWFSEGAPSVGLTVLIDGSEVGRASETGNLQVLPGSGLAIAGLDAGATIRNFRLYERRT